MLRLSDYPTSKTIYVIFICRYCQIQREILVCLQKRPRSTGNLVFQAQVYIFRCSKRKVCCFSNHSNHSTDFEIKSLLLDCNKFSQPVQ